MPLSSAVERALAPRAKPFLKWAGGKTQLLGHILPRLPSRYGRYYEPFLGGGAVFFALGPMRATLSDINPDLIVAYRAVRDDVEGVIARLGRLVASREAYYRIRAQSPARMSESAQAARTIYLNRTCFNGLYRVNAAGRFNVPYGAYARPNLCNADNLRRVSRALKGMRLRVQGVEALRRQCRRGDMVYFDPPYDPVSPTANFVGYARGGFGRPEQERLAQLVDRLASRGVHVLLSNADTPYIRHLYRRFVLTVVPARRAINRNAARRGPVAEVLVSAEPLPYSPAQPLQVDVSLPHATAIGFRESAGALLAGGPPAA